MVLLAKPVVAGRVTALPTVALTQVLRRRSVADLRTLVKVQTIAASAAFTVSILPASAVVLPVQASAGGVVVRRCRR